jgi:hypothetical protein
MLENDKHLSPIERRKEKLLTDLFHARKAISLIAGFRTSRERAPENSHKLVARIGKEVIFYADDDKDYPVPTVHGSRHHLQVKYRLGKAQTLEVLNEAHALMTGTGEEFDLFPSILPLSGER